MKFSRYEYMIVAGLVLLVASVTVPTFFKLRSRRYEVESRRGMERLLSAGARYRLEYGMWPAARRPGVAGDMRFGFRDAPNREVINVLLAQDGLGNKDHALNPRRMVFLEMGQYRPGRSGLDDDGDMLDAWGVPYQIVLDADLNGVCEVEDSIYAGGIDGGMIIWSCGPDRKSDTRDDLLSWRR